MATYNKIQGKTIALSRCRTLLDKYEAKAAKKLQELEVDLDMEILSEDRGDYTNEQWEAYYALKDAKLELERAKVAVEIARRKAVIWNLEKLIERMENGMDRDVDRDV